MSPRRHPDFAWAWLTKFAINLGNAMALLYLLEDPLRTVRRHPGTQRIGWQP